MVTAEYGDSNTCDPNTVGKKSGKVDVIKVQFLLIV